jgi:hypothetical protein
MIHFRRALMLALAIACIAFPGAALGQIVREDWKTSGDGLIAHDTVTGLNWLNLTVTTDQSYNYVESQFGPGGLYAGFQHATYSALYTFQVDAGIPDIGVYTAANLVPVENLISLVGVTNTFSGGVLDSDGFYNGMQFSPTGYHDRFHLSAPFLGNQGVSNFYGDSGSFDDNYHDPRVGQWLVSVASVPEPATLPMLAGGLAALLWWRRRAMKGRHKQPG